MVGRAETMLSPSSSMTRRRTPCVLGCCGPMFTVIVSVRSSGMATRGALVSGKRAARDATSADSTRSQITWSTVRCPSWIAGRGRPGDGEDEIRVRRHLGGRRAGDGDRRQAAGPRRAQAVDDVRRAARRRDADRHVAGAAERLDLAAEHALEAVVVADRGEHAGVRGQRQRRQGAALAGEAAGQLGGEVLRLGGGSAVAEHQHAPIRGQRGPAERGGLGDLRGQRLESALDADRVGDRAAHRVDRVGGERGRASGERACPGADGRVGRGHRGTHARGHAPGRAFVPGAAPPACTRRDSMLRTNSSSVTWVGDAKVDRRLDLHRVVLPRREAFPVLGHQDAAADRDGRRRPRRTGRRPRARTSWRWARCPGRSAARRRRRRRAP